MTQTLRKERAETIQSSASDTRYALHMPDGPEQEARDRKFSAKPGEAVTIPDKWSDPSWQDYAWGTDVRQDALNYISTVQPFSLGNLRSPLPTQPRPTLFFGQAPSSPGKHGPQTKLRYRLTSYLRHPFITDNEELEQPLPQPVSHERFGLQTNAGSWSSRWIMEFLPTPETGSNSHGRQHTSHCLRLALHQKLLRSLRVEHAPFLSIQVITLRNVCTLHMLLDVRVIIRAVVHSETLAGTLAVCNLGDTAGVY